MNYVCPLQISHTSLSSFQYSYQQWNRERGEAENHLWGSSKTKHILTYHHLQKRSLPSNQISPKEKQMTSDEKRLQTPGSKHGLFQRIFSQNPVFLLWHSLASLNKLLYSPLQQRNKMLYNMKKLVLKDSQWPSVVASASNPSTLEAVAGIPRPTSTRETLFFLKKISKYQYHHRMKS